jgi:hypothetical protein
MEGFCLRLCKTDKNLHRLGNSRGTSAHVQVFGRRDDYTIKALLRPASEKRQGTKSREVGGAVQRTLWGFGRGVRLEEIGTQRSTQLLLPGERRCVQA